MQLVWNKFLSLTASFLVVMVVSAQNGKTTANVNGHQILFAETLSTPLYSLKFTEVVRFYFL